MNESNQSTSPPPAVEQISGRQPELVELVGFSRLQDTLEIVDRKLKAHSYKVKFDWISTRLLVVRNILLAVGGLTVFAVVAAVFLKETTKETTTIEVFDVATDLDKRGLTPRVLAKMLYDEMVKIQTVASANANRKQIAPSAWKLDNSLTIPETKLTVGALFSYVRGLLNFQSPTIDGELIEMGENLQLRVRVRGQPHATFVGPREKLDELLGQAAEHIYLSVEPVVLSIYRRHSGNHLGAIEAARAAANSKDTEKAAEGLYEWGATLQSVGRDAEALTKIDEALRLKPNMVRAYYTLFYLMPRLGMSDELKRRLETLVANYPNEAIGYGILSDTECRKGSFKECRVFIDKALARDPNEPAAKFWKAILVVFLDRDYELSLRIGQEMYRYARTASEPIALANAMQIVSNAQIFLRNLEDAESVINEYLKERPGDSRGHYRRSQLLIAQHKYPEAISAAEEAMRLGAVSANRYLIEALAGAGRVPEAIAAAEKYIAVNKNDAFLPLALGYAHMKGNDFVAAIAAFNVATSMAPDRAEAWLGLGRAHLAAGDIEAAMKMARTANKVAPNWSAPHVLLGDAEVAGQNASKALAAYQLAIKLDPKWGEPRAKLGKLLAQQGDEVGAKQKYREAFAREPWSEEFKKLAAGQ